MKKIVSILLAVLMIFSLTATAFAANDVKVTFTDERGYVLKEITVAFGEDYNAKAPEETTIDGDYMTYISGWESDHAAFKGTILTKLPVINKKDGITDITFKAVYTTEEITTENVVGGVVDNIFGEDTSDMLSNLIATIKAFFQKFILFLINFTF